MSSNQAVILAGNPIHVERVPAAAITPGMLIEFTSANKVQAHSNAGLVALKMFLDSNTIEGDSWNTAIGTSDIASCAICPTGTQVNALLRDGETSAIGTFLESAGNGMLRAVDTDTTAGSIQVGSIVAVALEALSATSTGALSTQRLAIVVC